MAAIEQIIQISSNERTADTALVRAEAAVRPSEIRGAGVTTSTEGGRSIFTFDRFNLSNAHTFTNAATRNAGFPYDGGTQTSADIEWNIGDIAILSQSSQGTRMESVDSPYAVTGFVGPGVRIFNAWDVDNDQLRDNLGFADGDTIRFRNTSGDIVGTTTPGNNGNFVVSNLRRISGTAHVLFDITPALGPFDPALDVGSAIVTTQSVSFNINSGTYVYTGATSSDAHTGATVDNDWVLLEAPGGAAAAGDLATFSTDAGATTSRLDAVEYDGNNNRLSFTNAGGTVTNVDVGGGVNVRRFYRYSGAARTITGLSEADTGNQTFTIATAGMWTATNGGTPPTSTWPQNASLYANGLKLTYGTAASGADWIFDGTRANLTITVTQAQRRELGLDMDGTPRTRTLNMEMETLETG